MRVNNCSELEFAKHLAKAQIDFEEQNKIYRWKIVADLTRFGLKNATIKERNIPLIDSPYKDIDWTFLSYQKLKGLFEMKRTNDNLIGVPKVNYIEVDNYQGTIAVSSIYANKIEWYLDSIKIKTKYNIIGEFNTVLKTKNLVGKELYFMLLSDNGQTISKTFRLYSQGVV